LAFPGHFDGYQYWVRVRSLFLSTDFLPCPRRFLIHYLNHLRLRCSDNVSYPVRDSTSWTFQKLILLSFCRKIFIGGLKGKTTKRKFVANTCWWIRRIIIKYFLYVLDDLRVHFSQFGEIQFISIKTDIENGWSRGFAFIVFKTTEGRDNVSSPFSFINLIFNF